MAHSTSTPRILKTPPHTLTFTVTEANVYLGPDLEQRRGLRQKMNPINGP
jgi:hypothetical protein